MNAVFVEPLRRSWDRMQRILFRPFQIETWIVLGFAAFLSELGRSRGGLIWRWTDRKHADELLGTLRDFLDRPGTILVVAVLAVLALVLGVVLIWVSARGRFVFLEGVVHERAGVVEPWKRHARPGNSLFLLELGVALAALAVFCVFLLAPLLGTLRAIWRKGALVFPELGTLLLAVALAGPLFLLLGLFRVLTNQFVVPIMWKHGIGAGAAWARFGTLLRSRILEFVVYLLFLLLLVIGIACAVVLIGLFTCCVGFILLAIPYLGSVLLLPVLVTLRSFGPEFLAQFGPEWDVFPRASAS